MRTHSLIRLVCMIAVIATVVVLLVVFGNVMFDRYSVPNKDDRRQNLILSSGTSKMSESNIAHEITLALSRHTNWDNLFLSENFKRKYKSRKNAELKK